MTSNSNRVPPKAFHLQLLTSFLALTGHCKVGGIRNVGWRQSAYTLAPSSNPVSPQNIHTPGSTRLLPCNSH